MGINPAETRSKKLAGFDQLHDLVVRDRFHVSHRLEELDGLGPASQIAHAKLAQNMRMHPYPVVSEQLSQKRVRQPEMVSPD